MKILLPNTITDADNNCCGKSIFAETVSGGMKNSLSYFLFNPLS